MDLKLGSGCEMLGKSHLSGLSAVCTENIHESSVKRASLSGQVLSIKNSFFSFSGQISR